MSKLSGPSLGLDLILEDIEKLNTKPGLSDQLASTIGVETFSSLKPTSSQPAPHLPDTPDQAVSLALEFLELEKLLQQRAEEVESRDMGGRLESTGKTIDQLLRILDHPSLSS